MRHRISILVFLLVCLIGGKPAHADSPFIVAPYLQLGAEPRGDRLELLWEVKDAEARWAVQTLRGQKWSPPLLAAEQRVTRGQLPTYRSYRAALSDLKPGELFQYRVLRDGTVVFTSSARAVKSAQQAYRFVAIGDCGSGLPGQKKLAFEMYRAKPDLVLIPGDVAYTYGRVTDYRKNFFPVYNADKAEATSGVPMMRSTLFVACAGNHDVATAGGKKVGDMDQFEDSLAYFTEWSLPLNGPRLQAGDPNTPLVLGNNQENKREFLAAAGNRYPQMTNYSFDYGDVHWTVLDANYHMNWNNAELRSWVQKDLERAQTKKWHFVMFHQIGFNSSKTHDKEQRMRLLAELFEKEKVDVVICGHVHDYQRTLPLQFKVKPQADGQVMAADGQVDGDFVLDREYDGVTHTKPHGVLYLVSGAGGAVYPSEKGPLQPFTAKLVAGVNSMTVVDVTDRALVFRQIGEDGQEIDRFTVTR